MIADENDRDSGLILAAEECPDDKFDDYHKFSTYDDIVIRKLSAHGPVLVRGGRGSGKSALLIEAYRRMKNSSTVMPIYLSLRYLPLLQSDGSEYISHFCILLSNEIQKEIKTNNINTVFSTAPDQVSMQQGLTKLAQDLNKRIVLLFDDAAHIGREKPLEVFFDLFRTLSSNLASCKASIYPGVTKFGIRFDVFNDSTVIDISRSEVLSLPKFFPDVIKARYPKLAEQSKFSDSISTDQFANLLGRAVVGNIRGFILACNRFEEEKRIGIPEITKCFLDMASDYYWPLMDEVAPKLGIYEELIDPARDVIELIVKHATQPVREKEKTIAQDRVLVHRQIVSQYGKIFEILEYLGFIARREASRAMKSGGRGPVFAINLCNLLDSVPSKRLTSTMIEEWTNGTEDSAELHITGTAFHSIKLPTLSEENGLAILERPISILSKSKAYPYGLSPFIIDLLVNASINNVGDLANLTDAELDDIENIGTARIKIIRDVLYQAIWM